MIFVLSHVHRHPWPHAAVGSRIDTSGLDNGAVDMEEQLT